MAPIKCATCADTIEVGVAQYVADLLGDDVSEWEV